MADQDVRLQDYIDDKFQIISDFDTIDSLLQNVQAQQHILKQQLADAKRDYRNAQSEYEQQAAALSQQAEIFQKEQHDIDRTLMIVTQSEASDEAMEKMSGVMDTLQRLEVAAHYVEMLTEVEDLSAQGRQSLDTSIESSLSTYSRLQEHCRTLQPLQEAAEGAAPHLIDHISRRTQALHDEIQRAISAQLEKTMKLIGWPRPEAEILPHVHEEWAKHVARLLDLQRSDLIALHEANLHKTTKDEPVVLLLLEVMVQPLAIRFQYHFSGDRLTNRLDKPEYFLTHVLDLLNDYAPFFQQYLQPLLVKHFQGSDLALTPAYVDATSALITALLPLLRRKLSTILPDVAKQPNLLSNLIHEVMAFDTSLSENWDYAPLSPATPFRGLAHYILTTLSYYGSWLAVERDFALSRYNAIISDRSTGLLDYDSVDTNATKPTKAAIRVNDLLETITDRYRPLSSFSQKMRFLIDIQIAIFDRFHGRLHESLEAYLTRTSAVARTVHGVSGDDTDELIGTKGLDRLCRVYGSAEYLEKAMSDWSEDVFFLDLWEELQYRAQHPESIRGDLTMQEIAAKTSSSITDGSNSSTDEVQGALFDETVASYHRLRVRSEHVLVQAACTELKNSLRPYSRVNTWASMSVSASEASLTTELDPTIRLLDEYLGFLSTTLGQTALRRIGRQIGHSIQDSAWDSTLLRHSFSTAGAAQFAVDMMDLWRVMDRYLGQGHGKASMPRLAEGLVILSLPVRGEIPIDLNMESSGDGGEVAKRLGLWEVEKRFFASNESARDVLEELGLEVLSEGEAREVMKRRVEISS